MRPMLALATTAVAAGLPSQIQVAAGRVLDRAGLPAAQALVLVRGFRHPEILPCAGTTLPSLGQWQATTETAADGRFRVDVPHSGPFLIEAVLTDDRGVAFPILAGDYTEILLGTAVRLRGLVQDQTGTPVQGASVALRAHPGQWPRFLLFGMPTPEGSTVTDREGRFAFDLSPPPQRLGQYEPQAMPWVRAGELMAGNRHAFRRHLPEIDLTMTLEPGYLVRGRVQSTKDDAPRAGVRVSQPLLPDIACITDERGDFELRGLWLGNLIVQPGDGAPVFAPAKKDVQAERNPVRVDGPRTLTVRLLDPKGTPLADSRVLVAMVHNTGPGLEWSLVTDGDGRLTFAEWPAAGTLAYVRVENRFVPFWAGGAPPDGTTVTVDPGRSLRGQVLSPTREPVAYARVGIVPQRLAGTMLPRITWSDRGGRFHFPGVLDEDYLVMVAADEQGSHATVVTRTGLGEHLEVALEEGSSVAGVVRDVDGRPLAGASVALSRAIWQHGAELPGITWNYSSLITHTDDQGRFHFRGLPGGRPFSLLVEHVGDGRAISGGGSLTVSPDRATAQQLEIVLRN